VTSVGAQVGHGVAMGDARSYPALGRHSELEGQGAEMDVPISGERLHPSVEGLEPKAGARRRLLLDCFGEGGARRIRVALVGIASIGALLTIVVALVPTLHVAYRNASLRVALETAIVFVSTTVALLGVARFRQHHELADFSLVYAFCVFAVVNLAFAALARAVGESELDPVTAWALMAGRLLGAGLVAFAALAPARTIARLVPSRSMALAGLVVVAGVALLIAFVATRMPGAIRLESDVSGKPTVGSNTAVLSMEILVAALFTIAAARFTRRAERSGDQFLVWLAAGCVLWVVAAVHLALFPSLHSRWLYIGDVFRVAGYGAWLIGTAVAVVSYWEARSRKAVMDERRRLACDIHDGMAQDLAYVVVQTRELAEKTADSRLRHVASAAERALDDSRSAINVLTTTSQDPLDVVLARTAENVAGRAATRVQLELDGGIDVDSTVRDCLVRILREAVSNAVRHGAAGKVVVRLEAAPSLRLEVFDDGCGFDPATQSRSSGQYGLCSMRERAEATGGALNLESTPGRGTTVVVTWP
jgi:signal transduction histidine kinase